MRDKFLLVVRTFCKNNKKMKEELFLYQNRNIEGIRLTNKNWLKILQVGVNMINALIKIKILKLTALGTIVGGFVAGSVAAMVATEMCKKKKLKEKEES